MRTTYYNEMSLERFEQTVRLTLDLGLPLGPDCRPIMWQLGSIKHTSMSRRLQFSLNVLAPVRLTRSADCLLENF